MVDLPDGEEFKNKFSRFDTIRERDRHRTTAVALQQLYTRRAITFVVNT